MWIEKGRRGIVLIRNGRVMEILLIPDTAVFEQSNPEL